MTLLAILVAVLFILQLLDWYTTKTILNKGGKENNPIARWGIERFGLEDFLMVKAIVVTLLGFLIGSLVIEVLILLVFFYVFIVATNWHSMP